MRVEGEGDDEDSPSLRTDSPDRISAAADFGNNDDGVRRGRGDDDHHDFDFSFVLLPQSCPPIAAADDIFSDGKILPVYPLFNRDLPIDGGNDSADFTASAINHVQNQHDEGSKSSTRVPLRRLFIEEEREQPSFSSSSSSSASSSSSSSLDDLDAIPPGTYCVWNPSISKDRCRKSGSTGSTTTPSSLRWKLKDLVIGRSRSDGKEKFVFVPAEKAAEIQQEDRIKMKKGEGKRDDDDDNNSRGKKLGMGNSDDNSSSNKSSSAGLDLTAGQPRTTMYYGRNGQLEVRKSAGRKSFRPYKRNLVGFSGGTNAHGLNRTQDPF